jgi:hypothetical protein
MSTVAQSKKEQILFLNHRIDSLRTLLNQFKQSTIYFSNLSDSLSYQAESKQAQIESKQSQIERKQAEIDKLSIELIQKDSLIENSNRERDSVIVQFLDLLQKYEKLRDDNKSTLVELETLKQSKTTSAKKPKELPGLNFYGYFENKPIFIDSDYNGKEFMLDSVFNFSFSQNSKFVIYYFLGSDMCGGIGFGKFSNKILILDKLGNVVYDEVWDISGENYDKSWASPMLYQVVSPEGSIRVFLRRISTGCGSGHQIRFWELKFDGAKIRMNKYVEFLDNSKGFLYFNEDEGVFYIINRVNPPCHYDCFSYYEVNIYSLNDDRFLVKNNSTKKYNDFSMVPTDQFMRELRENEPKLFKWY